MYIASGLGVRKLLVALIVVLGTICYSDLAVPEFAPISNGTTIMPAASKRIMCE